MGSRRAEEREDKKRGRQEEREREEDRKRGGEIDRNT